MKKGLRIGIALLLAAVFCFSGWKLLSTGQEYRSGEKTYESMEQYIVLPETTPPAVEQTDNTEPEQIVEEPDILWPEVDFDALREINPDVVGWLYIEDTKINYPILQGEDNEQYLYRMIDGRYNGAGSLFLGAGLPGDFSGWNNPVYGHNMKNGSMFGGLPSYKKQEFYEEHPVALLMTPEGNYRVRIFSAYVQQADGDAWDTSFTEEALTRWLEERIGYSWITTGVVPTAQDKILTLSTCSYETDDSRFLVHGILEPAA